MPSYRLSQHSMDVVFKLEAQQLGSALARRFGIDLPPIVRHYPTELPIADVHLEQLDSVFELADGSLLHLEFQTEHRRETLTRFLIYDAALYERSQRHIHTVVIYGAGVATASTQLSFGAVEYRVENVLLGQQDGEATYQRLRAQVEAGRRLTPEDRLDLVFLPLMQHRRPPREVVAATLGLAQRLPERQQRQTLAALIGLGHRFLAEGELETLVEGLMSTSVGQRLLDRGYERGLDRGREQGREQGRQEGLEQAILRVLTRRFGAVPPSAGQRLAGVQEQQRLEALLDVAVSAGSLDEFMQALD